MRPAQIVPGADEIMASAGSLRRRSNTIAGSRVSGPTAVWQSFVDDENKQCMLIPFQDQTCEFSNASYGANTITELWKSTEKSFTRSFLGAVKQQKKLFIFFLPKDSKKDRVAACTARTTVGQYCSKGEPIWIEACTIDEVENHIQQNPSKLSQENELVPFVNPTPQSEYKRVRIGSMCLPKNFSIDPVEKVQSRGASVEEFQDSFRKSSFVWRAFDFTKIDDVQQGVDFDTYTKFFSNESTQSQVFFGILKVNREKREHLVQFRLCGAKATARLVQNSLISWQNFKNQAKGIPAVEASSPEEILQAAQTAIAKGSSQAVSLRGVSSIIASQQSPLLLSIDQVFQSVVRSIRHCKEVLAEKKYTQLGDTGPREKWQDIESKLREVQLFFEKKFVDIGGIVRSYIKALQRIEELKKNLTSENFLRLEAQVAELLALLEKLPSDVTIATEVLMSASQPFFEHVGATAIHCQVSSIDACGKEIHEIESKIRDYDLQVKQMDEEVKRKEAKLIELQRLVENLESAEPAIQKDLLSVLDGNQELLNQQQRVASIMLNNSNSQKVLETRQKELWQIEGELGAEKEKHAEKSSQVAKWKAEAQKQKQLKQADKENAEKALHKSLDEYGQKDARGLSHLLKSLINVPKLAIVLSNDLTRVRNVLTDLVSQLSSICRSIRQAGRFATNWTDLSNADLQKWSSLTGLMTFQEFVSLPDFAFQQRIAGIKRSYILQSQRKKWLESLDSSLDSLRKFSNSTSVIREALNYLIRAEQDANKS